MDLPSRAPHSPLPGTGSRPAGLFVDRWGTLLERPAKGWCARFRDARFHEGAVEALFKAQRAGWFVYLIGNEDQVAQGRVSDSTWSCFEQDLLGALAAAGVMVKRCYSCLDDPGGKGAHAQDSVFRLPNTGVFYHAAHTDGIQLSRSWVVGDHTQDLVAGWRAGCRLGGVRTGEGLADGTYEVEAEILADGLGGVLAELFSMARAA